MLIDKFVYLVDYRIESSGLFVAFARFFIFSHALLFICFHDSECVFKGVYEYVFKESHPHGLNEFVYIRSIISSMKPVGININVAPGDT